MRNDALHQGARVMENVLLRDMNLNDISARDSRRVEVVANGLPLWRGAQLAVDITFVSPVRRNGEPQPGASDEDGVQLRVARRRKERTYRELLNSRRCRLARPGSLLAARRWRSGEPGLALWTLASAVRARLGSPCAIAVVVGRARARLWLLLE